MAHRGEKTNGRHYAQARGFSRLQPVKTEEEKRAEQVLKDFEAGKYGPPPPPEEKPKPPEKPTLPPQPETPQKPEKPRPIPKPLTTKEKVDVDRPSTDPDKELDEAIRRRMKQGKK